MRTPEKSSLVLPAPDVSVPLRRMWKWSLAWRREGRLRELLSMLKTGLVLQTELKNNVDRYCITGTKNNVWPTTKKTQIFISRMIFSVPRARDCLCKRAAATPLHANTTAHNCTTTQSKHKHANIFEKNCRSSYAQEDASCVPVSSKDVTLHLKSWRALGSSESRASYWIQIQRQDTELKSTSLGAHTIAAVGTLVEIHHRLGKALGLPCRLDACSFWILIARRPWAHVVLNADREVLCEEDV